MPIGAAVRFLADADPGRPAITCGDKTVTREEFEKRTNRLARAYLSLGVKPDDLVTIGLLNSIEFYESAVAVWKAGATPQPISSHLPVVERDQIIALANPALVVGLDGDLGDRASIPADFEPAESDDCPLEDRVAASFKAPTSGGSTGRPKIILAGQPAVVDPRGPFAFGLGIDGVNLVPGPLYHNAPFVFSMQGLLTGNHLVVMPKFDALTAVRLIESHRVDWTLLVPTMMSRMLRLSADDRQSADISSLRAILHLAAPCPPWVKEAWIDWIGPDAVWEVYAGTEAQGMTVINGREWLEHRGSVGRPVGCHMEIRDPNRRPLPPGEIGELWIQTSATAPTYRYIGAEATRDDDGWETLGDLGSIDADGYLYLADRRTDMILQGGANIYPAEVEAALDAHPQVMSSAVIGLPDGDLGQRIHAIVQVDGEVDDDALVAFLSDRLVRYKIPRSFERSREPLRDDAGKVRRSGLAAARRQASLDETRLP